MQKYTERLAIYLEKLSEEKIERENQVFSWQKELDEAKEMLDIIDEDSPLIYGQKRRILTAENIISNLQCRLEQIDIERAELAAQLRALSPESYNLSQER